MQPEKIFHRSFAISMVLLCFPVSTFGQSGDYSTFEKTIWTDDEILEEARRYTFKDLNELVEEQNPNVRFVILSGFLQVGKYWKSSEGSVEKIAPLALERREELTEAIQSARPIDPAAVTDHMHLMRTERRGDWDCAIGYGCYPKGYVIGLGPITAEEAANVCEFQRRQNRFCYIHKPRWHETGSLPDRDANRLSYPKSIPEPVPAYLRRNSLSPPYAHWSEAVQRQSNGDLPWWVSGDFDGNGVQDWAGIALAESQEFVVIAVLNYSVNRSHIVLKRLGYGPRDRTLGAGVYLHEAGTMRAWPGFGETHVYNLKHPSIEIRFFESSAVVYFWRDGKFEFVWISD